MPLRVERIFKRHFGSNVCRVSKNTDGSLEVDFDLPDGIQHLMRLKTGIQVLHAIRTINDPHWFPKLKELDQLSKYLGLLRKLCEDKTYPTEMQISKIRPVRRELKSKMTRILSVLYGRKFMSFIDAA